MTTVASRVGKLRLAQRPAHGGSVQGCWRREQAVLQKELRDSASFPLLPYSNRLGLNDGKVDASARFWIGTLYEPRDKPAASLYRWAHTLYALDFDMRTGVPSRRRVLAHFSRRVADMAIVRYGGRPDGATVDAEGCLWVAMFEGARVLRLFPSGKVLRTLDLPVRCPTMPCLGGPDLRTLYITTGRDNRPPDELAAMPLSGCVLRIRVDVPGLPVNLVRRP
ncbi:hypothetical protein BH11PSE8_BH11PSE8_05180 [soil metagenome]